MAGHPQTRRKVDHKVDTGMRCMDTLAEWQARGQHCDVAFLVSGERGMVLAHKVVLLALSPYFADKIPEKSDLSDPIEITDTKLEDLQAIVNYLYTGSIDIDLENVRDVLVMAQKFKLTALEQECASFIKETLDVKNCLEAITFSERYRVKTVKHEALRLASVHFDDLSKSPDVKDFSPDVLEEWLSGYTLHIKSKQTIFNGEHMVFIMLIGYLKARPDLTKEEQEKVLSLVKLPYLPEEDLHLLRTDPLIQKNTKCLALVEKAANISKGPDVGNAGWETPRVFKVIAPPPYEAVMQNRSQKSRPIVILGVLKDVLNDLLLEDFPERFSYTIPHTTRARRPSEIDGKDYHFVSDRDQMQREMENQLFLECGQYNGNLYGTSLASVRRVLSTGKHCILDVSSAPAIKRLEVAKSQPISILVRPKDLQEMRQLRGCHLTEDKLLRHFEKACRLEEEYGSYFTEIISGRTQAELYDKVKAIIRRESGSEL